MRTLKSVKVLRSIRNHPFHQRFHPPMINSIFFPSRVENEIFRLMSQLTRIFLRSGLGHTRNFFFLCVSQFKLLHGEPTPSVTSFRRLKQTLIHIINLYYDSIRQFYCFSSSYHRRWTDEINIIDRSKVQNNCKTLLFLFKRCFYDTRKIQTTQKSLKIDVIMQRFRLQKVHPTSHEFGGDTNWTVSKSTVVLKR